MGKPDPVTQYAQAATKGKLVAGRLVHLACQRHLRDLKDGPTRGLSWHPEIADRVFRFFGALCLSDGAHAGQPFTLQPFQQFIIGSLFGWMGPDGTRRFRMAYIEMGKGNGKSPLAAGVGLYGLTADNEPGAECYSAAVTRDQARILFEDAKHMVEGSPALARRIEPLTHTLTSLLDHSVFRPVSSEGRGLDGKRVHMALIDELHEHPSALVADKMRAGTKGRRQALIFEITNSGYDRQSVCWQHRELSRKILEQIVDNDAWFAYVCQLDPCEACRADGRDMPNEECAQCDQYTTERVWVKANPCLGVSVPLKYLREQVAEAVEMPSKQNIVKRLNFCIWTQSAVRWMPAEKWRLCGQATVIEARLIGRTCYSGLDLASTIDIAALVHVFGEEDGSFTVLPRFWIPEECLEERVRRDRVPYDVWLRQGWLMATPGNVIDYAYILKTIDEDRERFNLAELAFDRWGATRIVQDLDARGVTVVQFGQGYVSMSPPMKELLNLVRTDKLRHGGHPVLTWMADNVVADQDAAGNIKPNKAKSTEKIDGIVAMLMGLDRAMRHEGGASVYETRGVIAI